MKSAKKIYNPILAFLLSAALLTEPVYGTTTVYAEEQNAEQLSIESVEEEVDLDSGEESQDSSGEDGNLTEWEDPQEGDSDQKEAGDTASDGETPEEQEAEAGKEEQETEEVEEPSVSENALEEISVSANDLVEESREEADSGLFSEMPSNYALSSEQKAMKSALSASMGQFDDSQEGKTYVERQVFAFADTGEEAEDIANAYCAELIEYDEGVAVLKLAQGISVGAALRTASDMDNNLPAVYPDYYRYTFEEEMPQENASLTVVEEEYEPEDGLTDALPNGEPTVETYAAVQAFSEPNMSYDSAYYQWHHANVGSAYAWYTDKENEGRYIKVAVLDTGVMPSDKDSLHCDLQTNKSEEADYLDKHGHGTHVAAIIGAKRDDKGGAGIAPQAEIVNVKVSNNQGVGKDSDIIEGIKFVIDKGNVDIINMSLGGIGYNPALAKVIDQAYESGIAVFAGAGNDGGSNMTYPAALENVICVAAIDKNNQRAAISNYGSWVDLSAPGVDIWSMGIAGDTEAVDGFRSMSGTSQAAAVAAGEAAVILSAKLDSIPKVRNAEKVKALKKVMQENAMPVGSGMGKGVTKLTKVFNLSAEAERPKAPTIECIDKSNDTEQALAIRIRAQNGTHLYYTTDGRNPIYKNGEAGSGTEVRTNWETITVSGETAAKGTVKAMAVSASGAVSPIISKTWTLTPYVKKIVISGPERVEKNKSVQLAAAITPAYASNKKITWTLLTEDGRSVDPAQIKIDPKKGKITTTDKAAAGKYKVTATAQDNPDPNTVAKEEYTVEVIEPNKAIQQITIKDKPQNPMQKVLWLESQTQPNTVSLLDYVVAQEKDLSGKKGASLKEITDREALEGRLQWTSSKPAVATVDSAGTVTAKAVGTTTITVKADDNLGKKAAITITVKNAVTKITITTDKGRTEDKNFTVARGKSITLNAKISPDKPTDKRVYWSIAPGAENAATAEDMKNITINKTSGKVTVKADAKPGQYNVTAVAADGQGASATRTITVFGGAIAGIELSKADQKVTLYTKKVDATNETAEKPNETEITVTIKGTAGECDPKAYMVTNSNDSVVRVRGVLYSPGTSEGIAASLRIQLWAPGVQYGKANIVIAATDGSKKKATCTVTVKGGISKAELVDTQGGSKKVSSLKLFRKGTTSQSSAVLYAKITGPKEANAQAYNVTSSNPNIVKVTKVDKDTGMISIETAINAVGKATITLMATDGSKKKATCAVTVVNPVSRIHIAPKGDNLNFAAKGKSLQLQATLECEYGAVSSKKVTWGIKEDTGKTVTINGSGKINVKKNTTAGSVTVTAKACDGSNVQADYTVYITDPVKGIGLWENGKKMKTTTWWTKKVITQTADRDVNGKGGLGGCYLIDLDWDNNTEVTSLKNVSVSSSNPGVMSAAVRRLNGKLKVALSADRSGTATITIKAMDGGGSQVKYKFKVVD